MATTTSNFSWPIPQSTDLVKDGATAIASLGSGIDTSMAELKGGTTGQILSKTSGTDMDFTWITPNPGDITGVTAGTGLTGGGTSGSVTLDFDVANYGGGQKAAGKNAVINGGFDIWQRGTSLTYSGSQAFIADRWQGYINGTSMTISRQATNDTTNLPNIQYCARIQRTASSTNVNSQYLQQNFETVNSIPFAGKIVTLSFYARAGANYSPTSNALRAYVVTGTGTDQNWLSTGYTGSGLAIDATATLTTTWQRFTYTGTVPSNNTELTVAFFNTPTGTAGANDYYEVTGVQLELGSTATPFSRAGGTIQGELAACQRYYYRATASLAYSQLSQSGFADGTTTVVAPMAVPVVMRVAPISVEYSAVRWGNGTGGAAISALAVSGNQNGAQVPVVAATVSGVTSNNSYRLMADNNTSAYIGISAEL